MEALWKPQRSAFDPQRPAEFVPGGHFANRHLDPDGSRPLPLALSDEEVTGSIPVGSMGNGGG
jgi:hypothetical protein